METLFLFLRIWTLLCLRHVTIVLGCPDITSRFFWVASQPSRSTPYLSTPVSDVFIHHSAGAQCSNYWSCSNLVQSIERYHMIKRNWADIGYNFLIGGDGSVFEGRGWNKVGAHTTGYNTVGYGICFLGTFTNQLPTQAALDAARNLINCGVELGKIQTNYVLRGHRDMSNTDCPGTQLYNLITTWPHY